MRYLAQTFTLCLLLFLSVSVYARDRDDSHDNQRSAVASAEHNQHRPDSDSSDHRDSRDNEDSVDHKDSAENEDDHNRRCERETAVKVRLAIIHPGIQSSIWSDGSVSLAIPLGNQGEAVATDIRIKHLQLGDAARVEPANLPTVIAELLPNEAEAVDARFIVPNGAADRALAFTIAGTFQYHHHRCPFVARTTVVPQNLPTGPFIATGSHVDKQFLRHAAFPPLPPPILEQFNDFDFNIIAQGEHRNFMQGPMLASPVQFLQPQLIPNLFPDPIFINDQRTFAISRHTTGSSIGGFPPDPSVAGADASDVVLMSYNTAIDVSRDGGKTFTRVPLVGTAGSYDPSDPSRNALFPQDDGGVCCDQVLTYLPDRGIYVWLLQYWWQANTNGPNRLRIAWATPAAIKADFLHAWTWVDLTSAGFGIGIEGLDYPDLAFSDNYVFVGVDHVINQPGGMQNGKVYSNRHIFARLSLNDIVDANVPTVGYSYVNPTYPNLIQNHIVQSSRDAMYFGALPNTSSISLFTWPDNSNSVGVVSTPISSFNPTGSSHTSLAPDGANWNAAPSNILGAVRVDPFVLCDNCNPPRYIYMAFSAATNGAGRPYPYVRVVKLDANGAARINESDIWNDTFAFSTPALNTNSSLGRDEVALSLALGGNGNYGDNAVGFLGDFVVYPTTDSDTTQAVYNRDKDGNKILDAGGNPTFGTRFGDYYSVRDSVGPATPNGRGTGYSTAAYAVKTLRTGSACYDVGCRALMHYVQFGRPSDLYPAPAPPPPR